VCGFPNYPKGEKTGFKREINGVPPKCPQREGKKRSPKRGIPTGEINPTGGNQKRGAKKAPKVTRAS